MTTSLYFSHMSLLAEALPDELKYYYPAISCFNLWTRTTWQSQVFNTILVISFLLNFLLVWVCEWVKVVPAFSQYIMNKIKCIQSYFNQLVVLFVHRFPCFVACILPELPYTSSLISVISNLSLSTLVMHQNLQCRYFLQRQKIAFPSMIHIILVFLFLCNVSIGWLFNQYILTYFLKITLLFLFVSNCNSVLHTMHSTK